MIEYQNPLIKLRKPDLYDYKLGFLSANHIIFANNYNATNHFPALFVLFSPKIR